MLIVRRIASRKVSTSIHRRCFNAAATSKQKRALTAEQVSGKGKAPPPPNANPQQAAAAATTTADTSSLPIVPIGVGVVLVVGGGGAYYYYNSTTEKVKKSPMVVPTSAEPMKDSSASKEEKSLESKAVEEVVETVPTEGSNTIVADKEETPADQQQALASESLEKSPLVEVESTTVNAEFTTTESADEPATSTEASISAETEKAPQVGDEASSVGTVVESKKEEPPVLVEETTMTDKAIAALQEETALAAARSLVETHQSLATSVVDDLDRLNASQLKAKIFQLSAELQDRTKWEAVRLKEFLAMKEKETAEKYLEIVQKQRLELEEMMAVKLREKDQEHASTLVNSVREKEAAIQSVVEAALAAQQEEHKADMAAFEQVKATEIQSSMEEEFGKRIEEYKEKVAQDLQQKAETLKQLMSKLAVLESALETSQATKQGSLKAHRLSAAALALSEKLETSAAAADELATLQLAAGNEGVIATACATIPPSVKKGVPTVTMLQGRFEKVAKKCRQALLVPEDQSGLEGQLIGMFLASVRSPPLPDDTVDDDEVKLVQARELVAVGDLEEAISLLEKLPGQASLVLQDWKKEALDRVAVEKSLKVIKMECALLNQTCLVENET